MEYGDYMPHGMCLLWQPWLVTLWAGSDLLIFLSYTAIPVALLTVLRKREDVPHRGLVTLFASFILLCGLTHLLGIVTLWYPIYPWVGSVKLATGLVSMMTAIVLFRLIPTLVNLPSPAAIAHVNTKLRDEIAAHKQTLASLENKVHERTKELRNANVALAVQAREAVHRSGNLLAVVSSLAQQTAKGTQRTEDFLDTFVGRLQALTKATQSIGKKEQSSAQLDQVIDDGLSPLQNAYGSRVSYAGPLLTINPEAAQQISLALHELATNTQKYGLGAKDTVHVEVSWEISGKTLELVWREYGDGQANSDLEARSEGFGTKLLTRVIPVMLRGEATRIFEQDGFAYKLIAPLSAVNVDERSAGSHQLAASVIDETFGLDHA